MNPHALLDRLQTLGASLETDGENLRIKAGKGVITPDLLEQMKTQKSALITLLGQPAGHDFPQSYNQSQLWFLDQLQPGNPMYNNPLALRLDGPCDAAALDAALQTVVARHGVLRTIFFDKDGEPWQRVLDHGPTRLEITDISTLSHQVREQRAAELVREHAERAFDLETEPAIRAQLLVLGANSHILLLNVHHICADGWSVGILLDELTQTYWSTVSGQALRLPDLHWQYSDFVLEQRNRLHAKEIARQTGYWREKLAGTPDLLDLPTDRPRPAVQSFAGGHLRTELPAELTLPIKALCRASGVTPFAIFLAVHAIVMTRYANQDEICIGTPLAGRDRQELEPLIGHFINIVALRVRLGGSPSFATLIRQINDDVLGATENQDIAFEKVVEAVNPARSAGHPPLFQTMMIFQNTPEMMQQQTGALQIRALSTDSATAKYDITVELFQTENSYLLGFEYNTDLFDTETLTRISGQYETVLRAALNSPETQINDLCLTAPAPLEGQGPPAKIPASVHACFSEVARKHPEKVALEDKNGTLTFAELEGNSNRAAGFLHQHGVTKGARVALIAEPDAHYVSLMLAILRCGAAFVPIDPDTPAQRVLQILADSEVALVFTAPSMRQNLQDQGYRGHIFALDSAISEAAIPINMPDIGPDDLAAILFTSGSTGRAKGAMVRHKGLINLVIWTEQAFPADGPVLQKSSPGFDASLWEFIWPLLSGRRLVIAQGEPRKNPGLLSHMVEERQITALQFVPATLQLFLDGLDQRTCDSLAYIFCGGGALPTSLAREITERLPNVQLVNVYGLTECSVDSTFHIYDPAQDTGPFVPIGKPITGTSVLLLDAKGRRVPQGATGEICIGGTGVGAGYVNHASDAFTPTLVEIPGPWFRSGDLARMNNRGQLEFLGRRDFQIKLNGFRMEPAEIETALGTCGCEAAVVIASDGILVGYVTGAPDPATLKPALARLLPGYMIPSVIIAMERFTLNASGKIDRTALPAPHSLSNAVNQTTPRDATEHALYDIWCAILLHPSIGIRDNFFDVGGTSISAIKMLHLIKQRLGRTLSLRSIITNPTIEEIGGLLREGGEAAQGEEGRITFRRGSGAGNVVCVHPAGGTAFCYLSLAKALDAQTGVYGLQSPGLNPGEALAPTVEDMAAQYLSLIGDLGDAPLVITGLSYGGLVAHEMGRLLSQVGKQDVSVVLLDTQGTHDVDLRRRINTVDMEEFREKLVRFNGTYPGISDSQIQRYFEVYNHNRLTVRDYSVPVSGARIAFIQALSDLPRPFLHEVRRYWKSRTTGNFSTRLVRGDHWDMLETAELQTVRKVILQELLAISDSRSQGR